MTRVGALLLVVTCVAFGGCKADTKQALMQCKTDAIKLYPTEKLYTGTTIQFDTFMYSCMGGKAYDYTGACAGEGTSTSIKAACYAPSGWVSRWLDKLDPT